MTDGQLQHLTTCLVPLPDEICMARRVAFRPAKRIMGMPLEPHPVRSPMAANLQR